MKVVCKVIEMIGYFNKDGLIKPIRFRMEEEDNIEVIRINHIINIKEEKLCGNNMVIYTCSANINGSERIFELKYDIGKCKWMLFKI